MADKFHFLESAADPSRLKPKKTTLKMNGQPQGQAPEVAPSVTGPPQVMQGGGTSYPVFGMLPSLGGYPNLGFYPSCQPGFMVTFPVTPGYVNSTLSAEDVRIVKEFVARKEKRKRQEEEKKREEDRKGFEEHEERCSSEHVKEVVDLTKEAVTPMQDFPSDCVQKLEEEREPWGNDEYEEDYDEDLDLDNLDKHTLGELKKYCEEEEIEVKGNEKKDYISAILVYNMDADEYDAYIARIQESASSPAIELPVNSNKEEATARLDSYSPTSSGQEQKKEECIPQVQLQILSATFGSTNVLERVISLIKHDTASFTATVSNLTLGTSEPPKKALVIVYRCNDDGIPKVSVTEEGTTVTITAEPEEGKFDYTYREPPTLRILGAVYGRGDVTDKVKSRIRPGTGGLPELNIAAENSWLGDSWVNVRKNFTLVAQYSTGNIFTDNCNENERYTLKYRPSLTILSAAYGLADVTQQVRSLVGSRRDLSLVPKQALEDSWPGTIKTLSVLYQYGNEKPTMAVGIEQNTFNID